jgi:hypothetical protein
VTKSVYFDIRFTVVLNSTDSVVEFQPSASLRYEDGTPVHSSILDGVFKMSGSECRLRLRIKELSKTHRNQRFVVQIEARGDFGVTAMYAAPVTTLIGGTDPCV